MRDLKRSLVPAAAGFALLFGGAAADASSLNVGGRNPRHGSSKKGTRLVGKLGGGALQVSNVGGGPAFTFMTTGILGGTITVGKGGDGARPFTTNATGVATGLNADRLDGHHASDFVLAGSATNASTLGGKTAGDFLAAGGKAADSNLLDGLDSTAFLRTTGKAADSDKLDGLDSTAFLGATATAADSDKLDGIDSTGFVASSTRLSLGGHPLMTSGDPVATLGSAGGLTFKASCTGTPGNEVTHLFLATDAGTVRFATNSDVPGGVPPGQIDVTAAGGDTEVVAADTGNTNSGELAPFEATVVKSDGTIYQGVITLGVNFGTSDCFASGSLSS